MKLIKNVKIILRDRVEDGSILFSDKIEKIILKNSTKGFDNIIKSNKNIGVIDGEELFLSPGFIDVHFHGAAGFDTMDGSQDSLENIKETVIQSGVTSFLATTMTMSIEKIRQALTAIRKTINDENIPKGARVIGCHLEGPFINRDYKGAQAEENIVLPEKGIIDEFKDVIKLATVAPDIEGAEGLIKYIDGKNIVVSAGHTGASYEGMMTARKWGVTHITHLFNAMTKLHHREPGVIGAALISDFTCELIADFIHIHPAILKIVLDVKDLDKIILITDQMMAGFLGDGEYELGGQKVFVQDGAARLENGQLASSVLTMDQAVRNIGKISKLTVNEIINMATYNPALMLGMEDEIGSIKEGRKADFVLLNSDLEVINVYRDGQLQYSSAVI